MMGLIGIIIAMVVNIFLQSTMMQFIISIVGVLVFFILRETLADLGSIYLIMLGFVAIFVMIRAPKGIWGFVSSKYNIELFPLSRKLKEIKGE